MTYAFIDSSGGIYHYRVTLTIYQDCLNGIPLAIEGDNPAVIDVFNGTGTFIMEDTVSYSSYADSIPVTACAGKAIDLGSFCRNWKRFIKDFYLPANSSGYSIVYQHCCLNDNIRNISHPGSLGIIGFCSIPPLTETTYNTSAVFTNYPPFIISQGDPIIFDFSATDADGDSLTYELCTASIGSSPPPFFSDYYIAPLSFNNPIDCTVPLAIDSRSGVLTGTPSQSGTYVITVCCNEWRSGIHINTVHRDFEFTVVNCMLATPNLAKMTGLHLYPNPAQNTLTIYADQPIKSIDISDPLGKIVYSHHYNTERVEVSLAQIPEGVYFVKINGINVGKFVKE